jgi:flagellar hook-associated protein 3 FlgL
MRVSSAYISQSFVDSIEAQQTRLATTQQQITSGLRFSSPSEDPTAATQVIQVQATTDQIAQYSANANLAKSRLQISDSTLNSLTKILQRVRDLSVQGINATQTQDTRASIAAEMQQQLQSLVALGNSQDGTGRYIFAGSATTSPPFSQSGTTYSYVGDQTQRTVQIGASRTISDGDNGAQIFQQIPNGNGSFVVASNPANQGAVVVGANAVTDPVQWAAGTPPYTIAFTDATTYTVTDSALPAPAVTTNTYTDGGSISFNGIKIDVSGTPVAGDSFTVSQSVNQDIFASVQNAITALTGPTSTASGKAQMANGVNRALEAIDQSLTNVANVQAGVGARLQAIESQDTTNTELTLQLKSTMSSLRDLDYAAAITSLTQQQTSLQAAQASYVKIQNLSLFNYIQ